ncbi:Uncharacterized protein SAPIO_CDS8761 [Scedosporium apiospermum]|uniref:C2 domain-containing protein n=1 Tax=Pseudallescheria apiosperma TaxID=563466 RepID=A0A084FXM2_PSEDA|nr:Uncharacterized protein SAPIO_CDS8761 [Scedosporium apiospermum]KEZ39834.1 Uncharacterized protein SAPIO_CDS8761 [Scedosporium apiospermum]
MLASMLPPPLNSLRFTKIDFGKVPIHFVNIDVHKTDAGGIKLVMDLDWDGVCDIELNAEKLPKIGVQHVKLNGKLSILLCPLTNVIPLIGAAQVAFISPPRLHLDFTDAGGIGNIGLVDRAVRKIALSIISSMAVLPKRFLVKLDSNNDYFKTYQHPLGVLRLTIESGQNFGEEKKTRNILKKLVHDVPDCFVKVIVSPQDQWQTSTIKNDRHPEWNETHDFLVSDIEQVIELDVKDDDTVSDDNLGVGSTTVKQLLLDGGKQEINLNHEDQPTDAKVTLSGQFFRFVPDATSFSEQGSGICGLLTVLVASAFGIKGRRQELKPSVKVSWGEQVFRTAIKSDAPGSDIENPSFDQAFNVEIKAGMVPGPPVRIALMDKEEEIGAVEVGLGDVLAASDLALQQDFDIAQGTTVRAGIWLRGIRQA